VNEIRYLEDGQREAYLAALPACYRIPMEVLITTGMRLGELEAVKVMDLKLKGETNKIMVKDSKTETGKRTVFVPTELSERILAYVKERDMQPDWCVFSHWADWDYGLIRKAHRRAVVVAGQPNYTIHDHRHTAAVNLAIVGCPLKLIQSQLGHGTIQQTLRYAKYHPDFSTVKDYFGRMNVNEEYSE
jgi:integrase